MVKAHPIYLNLKENKVFKRNIRYLCSRYIINFSMNRLVTILLSAIVAISVLAQGQDTKAQNPFYRTPKVLWVIDGLIMDTATVVSDDFVEDYVEDSIQLWLERYFPIIKLDDIKEIQTLNPSEGHSGSIICCYANGYWILIKTHEESGVKELELNGIYTTKRKRIGLADLADENYLKSTIEKKWKIKQIKSIQIHPNGKTVHDKKGKPHQVYLSIETE